jgi:hypothetical protein
MKRVCLFIREIIRGNRGVLSVLSVVPVTVTEGRRETIDDGDDA